MLRLLAILILVAAGLPRLGVVLAGGHERCADSACHQPVVQMSCCAGEMGEDASCPMSDGACECAVAPAPEPEPAPNAPLPRSDRESPTGLPNGPPRIAPAPEPDHARPSMGSMANSLTAGRSHNETQALLGIWRT